MVAHLGIGAASGAAREISATVCENIMEGRDTLTDVKKKSILGVASGAIGEAGGELISNPITDHYTHMATSHTANGAIQFTMKKIVR